MAGIGVHDDRNRCSTSVGTGVHLRPEWAFTMGRNTQKPRIAPRDAHLPQVFTVTHPFHPLHGQTFELLTYRFNWGEDRVMYVGSNGRTRSLPVGWTNVAAVDPFVGIAAGRAPFRLEDLLALTALVRDISPARRNRAPGKGSGVK